MMNKSNKIQYPAWPVYAEDEIQAVTDVLRSGKVNYWTGDKCKQFEAAFADYTQSQYAIAVANGTVALELALIGLNIGAGDEVIVPCRSFIATASCVVMRQAIPVLADVDPISQNVSLETILPHITPKTRAIIVVHHAGWPVDIEPIQQFCRDNGLYLIEDCAQAHGARYKGQPVGSFADVAAFSFCQDKIMSTGGEGGMVVTDNEEYWRRMWSFNQHGKNYSTVFHQQHPPGFRWLHESFGTNWRMTEMQAAIGLCQLAKLDEWVLCRRQNAAILDQGLAEVEGVITHTPGSDYYHAYYKYYAFVSAPQQRSRLQQMLVQTGIPCLVGTCGNLSYEKAFQGSGISPPQSMPTSEQLSQCSLTLLLHPGCDSALMREVVGQIHIAMETIESQDVAN